MATSGRDHWKSERLENLCAQITDGKHGDCQDEPDSGFYFLSCKDVVNGKLNYEGARQITEADFLDTHRRTKFAPSDVLITNSGTIGRMALAPDNKLTRRTTFQKSVAILKPIAGRVEPSFLYYALQSDIQRLIEFAGGTAQKNLLLRDLRAFEVRVPPLPVQWRIAGILSAYDELIENSQRRIRVLEAMASALYREWFVHFHFPGHEKVPRVASPLGEVPKSWEVKRIGEVADIFRGRSYRSVDLAEEDGLPFLNLKCLDRDGGFRRSGLKRYTGEYKGNHVAKKGDIVMAVTDMTQERRIVARAALVPTLEKEFGISSMDLVRIEPKLSIPKMFLYSFLRYSAFADEVKQHANGANVLHLAPERITDFRLAVPISDLMRHFANFVVQLFEQMDTLESKVENLRQTCDLLLPRLLSGQIDAEAA
jgi:type I restriction enzyme, S subunit